MHSKLRLLLLTLALCALMSHARSSTLELQATHTQSNGCSFSQSQDGALGLSSNFSQLSTELPGGQRPTFNVHVVGTATLSLRREPMWYRNQQLLDHVNTQALSLHDQAHTTTALPLPLRLLQAGTHTFFVLATGFATDGFFEVGQYRAVALFDCL